jgi:hypothetical protein
MEAWRTYTPEGHPLVVRRVDDEWIARCADGPEIRRASLDLALIEALRTASPDVLGHRPMDAAEWTRGLADQIERERSAPD